MIRREPFTGSLKLITPADIYLPKFNNRNIRASCEICSKFTKNTLETDMKIVKTKAKN